MRRPWRIMVGAAAGCALLALAGCSCDVSSAPVSEEPGSSEMCRRLELPLDWAQQEDLSIADLVEDNSDGAKGIRGGIAFLAPGRAPDAGPFEPVLGYLAKRGAAEARTGRRRLVPPSKTVRANARKLDRFIADGGCG